MAPGGERHEVSRGTARSIALTAGALVVVIVLGFAPRARASPFELADRQWDGLALFLDAVRGELGNDRVIPVHRLEWGDLRREDGLLVVHPEHALDGDELTAFLVAGGRAAILDDFGAGDRILRRYQIERVPPPAVPFASIRHNPQLAIAEPASEALAGHETGVHPAVENVDRVVTNHPTGLRNPNLAPVLKIRAIGQPDVVLALACNVGLPRAPGLGRLFAMGDPSVLINQMLRYPGNRAFGLGLVRYLVEDVTSSRSGGKLYVIANRFSEGGTFGGGAAGMTRELTAKLDEVADVLRTLSTDGLPHGLAVALAAASLLGVAAWLVLVAGRTHRIKLPRYARPTPLIAQGGVAGRTAVLAEPTTPRALLALEIKSALEEALAHELGFANQPTTTDLLLAVRDKRALDEIGYRSFRQILLEMANMETSVAAGQPETVRSRRLADLAARADAILAMARERLASGATS